MTLPHRMRPGARTHPFEFLKEQQMPQLAPDVTWKYTAYVEKRDGSTSTISGYVSAMNRGIAGGKVSDELAGTGLTVRRIDLVKA